jgi:hypothetical protein
VRFDMKSPPNATLYDLPLFELRARSDRARELLRKAQARVSGAFASHERDRAAGLRAIDEALDATEDLLPGFSERPRVLLARTLCDLAPHQRKVLRTAIAAEREAHERLRRMLGEVSPAQAEDALDRVEAQESVAAELSALWRLFEQTHFAPMLAWRR